MKKYVRIVVIIFAVLLTLGIILFGINFLINKVNNKSNNYTIVTDTKYLTLRNDGGSNYNIYYEVDLNNNIVKKFEDYYIGFKGYEYQRKLIYSKSIGSNIAIELDSLLNDMLIKTDVNNTNNYSPYVIKYKDIDKSIYNKDSIQLLKEMIEQIDNY